jgi:Asp-tRNA(Asn)/Glu-tRNA(Gln) amidotransferase C subunit
MNTQTNELDKHIATVMGQISEAASKHDLAAIQRFSRKAGELHELKEQMAAIQHRMMALTTGEVGVANQIAPTQSNGKLRELPVEVTEGDIRQNLLKLTPHVKRGKIKVGEELIIEALPSGDQFQTVVSDKGNKLRARSEVARFYKDGKVKAGDYVLLTEVSPGRWTLKKAPVGEYGVSRLLREYA